MQIPTTTIEGYEKGGKIPADAFLLLADALNRHAFNVDDNWFAVTRQTAEVREPAEQLNLKFSGEYVSSRATVKISPGRITVAFDAEGAKTDRKRSRL